MNIIEKTKNSMRSLLRGLAAPGLPVFANSTGVHAGSITRLADAAISTRHLLAIAGSDADHVDVADAGENPLGVITDEAEAAEDPVAVSLLGCASTTLKMVASGAITAGALVYGADGGKVSSLSASAGTYYCVGRALNAASADGDVVEVDPCLARSEIVEA